MDGTLAALFFLFSLTDMSANYCATGCLTRDLETPALRLSAAGVGFQDELVASEIYGRYSFGQSYGPFRPVLGMSLSDSGDLWLGLGASHTREFGDFFAEFSFMPGLYARNQGPALGHVVEFRSGLSAGYRFKNGAAVSLGIDHRSNGELAGFNPGLETLQLSFTMPLR